MRGLMAFYGVDIPKPILAGLNLSVEKDELGIGAGLQDRVIQLYEGVMYMDFARDYMERHGYGQYESIDPRLLPPLYIAFDANRAQSSEQVHNPVRALFEQGDPKVVQAMKGFAALTDKTRELLLAGQGPAIGELLNANFDLRATIFKISEGNRRMIETARRAGASAKFTGSGGAIIGTYADDAMYDGLERELKRIGCVVFKPEIL
jgi:glucuronokinase